MKNNNKENNKKTAIKFVLSMVLLYIIGTICGASISSFQKSNNYDDLTEGFKDYIHSTSPFIFLILIIAALVLLLFFYISCFKMYKRLQSDIDNSELWDSLELKMNKPMIIADFTLIMDLFILGILLAYYYDFTEPVNICNLILTIIEAVICVFVSTKIVKIHKALNPDKKGNILDFNFNKVWLESSDEAEKEIIYKAGYKAYKNVNSACIILYVITFVGMLAFNTGCFAYICVLIIELINILSYALHVASLEKGSL